MATTILEHPVREIHGALERKGIINRMKKYRADDGRVIHEGVQESYAARNPRDYKKNPPKGAELDHINLFRQASLSYDQRNPRCRKARRNFLRLRLSARPKYLTKEEALSLLTDYRKCYKAQLPSTRGTSPDPHVPIDKNTHAPKRYFRLDNFIRSMVYQSLKAQQSAQQLVD